MDDATATVPQPKADEREMLDLLEQVAQATASEVTTNLEDAFGDKPEEWLIPTGRFSTEGRAVSLKVTVKDPMRPELPTQYLAALQKLGESRAALGLWQACIVEPKALKNPEIYEKTSTAFRATLTNRLMLKVGMNGDFFVTQTAMTTLARQAVAKSSTKLPEPTASTPAPSAPSDQPNSPLPTSTPSPSTPEIAPTL